jgi:hypothetical protein
MNLKWFLIYYDSSFRYVCLDFRKEWLGAQVDETRTPDHLHVEQISMDPPPRSAAPPPSNCRRNHRSLNPGPGTMAITENGPAGDVHNNV